MRKGKMTALSILVGAAIVAGAVGPFAYRPLALAWAKHKAYRALAKYKPDEMKNMEAVPVRVTLDPGEGGDPPLDSLVHKGYTIRYPHAESVDNPQKSWLVLTYPQFSVRMLPAYSTDDDDVLSAKMGYPSNFAFELAVEDARPEDLDGARDLASLERTAVLLAQKPVGFSLSTYSAVFNGAGRSGFIRDWKPDGRSIHAVIYFPATHTCDGMYILGSSAVDIAAVQKFLSVLEIAPAPAATTTAPATHGPE